jgi:hypothetical protein
VSYVPSFTLAFIASVAQPPGGVAPPSAGGFDDPPEPPVALPPAPLDPVPLEPVPLELLPLEPLVLELPLSLEPPAPVALTDEPRFVDAHPTRAIVPHTVASAACRCIIV